MSERDSSSAINVVPVTLDTYRLPDRQTVGRRLGGAFTAAIGLGLALVLAGTASAEHVEKPTPVVIETPDYDCSDLFPSENAAHPRSGLYNIAATVANIGGSLGPLTEEAGYCPDGEGNIAILWAPGISNANLTLETLEHTADTTEAVLRANGYDVGEVDVVVVPPAVVARAQQFETAFTRTVWIAKGGSDTASEEPGAGGGSDSGDGRGSYEGSGVIGPSLETTEIVPCVDPDGVHGRSLSQVAIEMMPELSKYRTIVGNDVSSCNVVDEPNGTSFVEPGGMGGVSLTGSRAANMYDVPPSFYLDESVGHEVVHNLAYVGHTSSYRDQMRVIEQLSAMGAVVDLETIIRYRMQDKTGNWEEYDSQTKTLQGSGPGPANTGVGSAWTPDDAEARAVLTSVQADCLTGVKTYGGPGSVTVNLDRTDSARLVSRYKGTDQPFGAVIRLDTPIEYTIQNDDGEIVNTISYDRFAFEMRNGSLQVYLVTDYDLYGLTGIVHVGTLEIGYTGMSRVIVNDDLITFQLDFSEGDGNGDVLIDVGPIDPSLVPVGGVDSLPPQMGSAAGA